MIDDSEFGRLTPSPTHESKCETSSAHAQQDQLVQQLQRAHENIAQFAARAVAAEAREVELRIALEECRSALKDVETVIHHPAMRRLWNRAFADLESYQGPRFSVDAIARARRSATGALGLSQHLSRDGEAKRPNTENDPNEPQGAEG